MTRKDYKRYKQAKKELAQLNQDYQDILERIETLYDERHIKLDGVNAALVTLNYLIKEMGLRRTIMRELLLPKWIKIEKGYQDVLDFWKDNNIERNNDDICEYISMYLTDSYNHNLYGFNWVVKGYDLFVTNIRWNKEQILESDVKHMKDGDVIVNDLVEIHREQKKGVFVIKDFETMKNINITTFKKTIEWLKKHYYM